MTDNFNCFAIDQPCSPSSLGIDQTVKSCNNLTHHWCDIRTFRWSTPACLIWSEWQYCEFSLLHDYIWDLCKVTIAQLGVQYGHMGYYFMTVAFMLVIVMLLSCCVPYHVVLLLDVMFILLHLSCLVCMYPNCFVAFPLYILVHGCPCFFVFGF